MYDFTNPIPELPKQNINSSSSTNTNSSANSSGSNLSRHDSSLFVEQLADQGHPEAQFSMAQSYWFGNPSHNIPPNKDKAIDYLVKSSKHHIEAATTLAS